MRTNLKLIQRYLLFTQQLLEFTWLVSSWVSLLWHFSGWEMLWKKMTITWIQTLSVLASPLSLKSSYATFSGVWVRNKLWQTNWSKALKTNNFSQTHQMWILSPELLLTRKYLFLKTNNIQSQTKMIKTMSLKCKLGSGISLLRRIAPEKTSIGPVS